MSGDSLQAGRNNGIVLLFQLLFNCLNEKFEWMFGACAENVMGSHPIANRMLMWVRIKQHK